MDIVSADTAKLLKDAGFPQPQINIGQAWYILEYDTEFPFIAHSPHVNKPTMDGSGWRHFDFFSPQDRRSLNWAKKPVNHLVYAPTATDILEEMGFGGHIEPMPNRSWMCVYKRVPYFHTNPAEAAALAFLNK